MEAGVGRSRSGFRWEAIPRMVELPPGKSRTYLPVSHRLGTVAACLGTSAQGPRRRMGISYVFLARLIPLRNPKGGVSRDTLYKRESQASPFSLADRRDCCQENGMPAESSNRIPDVKKEYFALSMVNGKTRLRVRASIYLFSIDIRRILWIT